VSWVLVLWVLAPGFDAMELREVRGIPSRAACDAAGATFLQQLGDQLSEFRVKAMYVCVEVRP
jgi:hypothetical protein